MSAQALAGAKRIEPERSQMAMIKSLKYSKEFDVINK